MSDDDLPPADERPEKRSLAGQTGEVFGAIVWIVLLLFVAGGIGLALVSWFR